MDITALGSCRLSFVKHNNLNWMITMSHSTKEVIQMIQFLKGKLELPSPYGKLCFRSGLRKNRELFLNDGFRSLYENTKIFLIEICSRKKYVHNGYYIFHEVVDKNCLSKKDIKVPKDIVENIKMEIQGDKEIRRDIKLIKKLLSPKKVIIISHYNAIVNDKKIEQRDTLINLLDSVCRENDIIFVNPAEVLKNYKQEEVLRDHNHYSGFGLSLLGQHLNEKIKRYIKSYDKSVKREKKGKK